LKHGGAGTVPERRLVMADNETLARELYEAWNNRNWQVSMDATAPDATITVMGTGETFSGVDGTQKYNKMWADAFPDGKITVDHVYSAGNCVVVEFTGRGTHTGTMETSMGSIPATGKSVTLHMCDVLEFSDGKVKEQRSYLDTGSLMAQLGLMSGQEATSKQ
jgi:steroid delta-isomerase-like uncharacterized protein